MIGAGSRYRDDDRRPRRGWKATEDELRALLLTGGRRYDRPPEGKGWRKEVEVGRLRARGQHEAADRLEAIIRSEVEAFVAAIRLLTALSRITARMHSNRGRS